VAIYVQELDTFVQLHDIQHNTLLEILMQPIVREIRAARKERDAERRDVLSRQNPKFIQVYPKGWTRLQHLIKTQPSAARLYALLAEHIDPNGGVVVAAQVVLAEMLDVNERTIRRLTKVLEDQSAIVRIRIGSGTYAYALDPTEVWKNWDIYKDHAVFRTKTLVSKSGPNATVKRSLQVMIREAQGAPELPLGEPDDGFSFDPETGEVFDT
jgi:hypothetical protein